MGAKSKIEWTDASWNPIRARRGDKIGWFCVHESEGCRNCYAETMNRRLGTGIDYKAQNAARVEIFLDGKMLTAPLRWQRPRKIFVGSMTDLFGDFVPDEMIDRMFAVMALCPQHTFQILTKRPERMQVYLSDPKVAERVWAAAGDLTSSILPALAANGAMWGGESPWPLKNVWLGTSCEDQATAAARIPQLLATPARIHFLSCEPLLGPVDLTCIDIGHGFAFDARRRAEIGIGRRVETWGPVDWVIVGGESGPHARPMHPDWARSLRDQCTAAGVPFFFKQWGEWHPDSERWGNGGYGLLEPGEVGAGAFTKTGKKIAGRYLDDRTWDEVPR